ncbi:MAG TPA: CorA family divalent cation transporter [Chitinophagaceae bacterium]|nr:CorA family divalent cation transporter [Chitinophagaceae bacterium]
MPNKEHFICEGVKWIDVNDPSASEMQALSKEYGLNEYIVRDCLEPDHLPKYDVVDNVHFLILRFFSHRFDDKVNTIQSITNKIALFYTTGFLITIHKEEVRFLDNIKKKYGDTTKVCSPAEVMVKILLDAVQTFYEPAQRLTEQIDFFENKIILRRVNDDLVENLYYLKRQASFSNKILMLMLDPINHVGIIPREDEALQDVRDQHIKIQTMYAQIVEDVNNLMGLYMSFSAQKTNDAMKVLTIFSVFFMPITFIAGLYGMNFQHMPELTLRWGYPAVIVAMIIITAGIYFWFKKKQWL